VFLHAQIEAEKGNYQIEDVMRDISDKLIRRHPHVFGDEKAENAAEVLQLWDKVKSKENNGQNVESVLDKVPKHFPPLTIAYKYQKQASKVGFDWEDYKGPMKKIFEEYSEIQNAINNQDRENLEHEIGDILFAVVNLGRFFDIRCDVALTKANNRFKNRFMHVEQSVQDSGKEWSDFTLEDLDKFWDEAKQIENNK
jgi:tetrapyrrole methylase family protein/MazG family protein